MITLLFHIIWEFPFLAIFSSLIPYIYFFRKQIRPTYLILIFHAIVNSHFFGLSNFVCILSYFVCDYTPPHFSGEVLCYTLRCLSVRQCSPFPIDNLSIYSRNFFKFCIHIVIGDEWYGIVNGQNPSIFNGVTALFRIGKMVSGLLFLYCSWYLNETSQICCTSKVTYCD